MVTLLIIKINNIIYLLDIGHIILIYNAASVKSKILYQLPEYTFKQYYYLRDVYPDCFPILNVSIYIYIYIYLINIYFIFFELLILLFYYFIIICFC